MRILAAAGGAIALAVAPASANARDAGAPGEVVQALRATTSSGRSGAYCVPSGERARAYPLLVMLHGTGGKGSLVMARLRPLAERERFIALAPDSASVTGAWLARPDAHGPTEDHRHVMAAVREVLALPGVEVDRSRVLVAGFSAGGGLAAHLGTHEDVFTALAVLHGHVLVDILGPRRVRAWLSAGDRDRVRSVAQVRTTVDELERRAGFREVSAPVFRAGHALGDDELAALVAWWLGPRRD